VHLLGLPSEETIGCLFSRLSGLCVPEPFLKLDGSGSPYDLHLHTKTGSALKATFTPIRKEQSVIGFIVTLSAKGTSVRKVRADSPWQACYTFADIVGESANLRACIAEAQKIAQRDLPVLITGESGTGKELFAQAMHNASRRREGPFVPLNCGGMSEELLSAELFGYVEGAFTGAVRGGRAGKLELAHGGTLFLDEVEEMSPKMQAHFLRVLEEGRVVRVGADKPTPIDVRIIAATNADLEARVNEGKFRLDLLYRLNVLTLSLPPLRERKNDISLLVKHILAQQGITKEVSGEALERLQAYCWPGNVRQLRNVLLQAAERAEREVITEVDLPPFICSLTCRPVTCPFPDKREEASAKKEKSLKEKAQSCKKLKEK
jgi:transcriptional regulator with PAS, ATPase and Fis domain